MRINSLELSNFRNYSKLHVFLDKNVNFFVGANGSGKTNLLESIYFLSLAKSYKTSDVNLIKYNTQFARIESEVFTNSRNKKFKVIITSKGKKAIVDGVEIKRLSSYIGLINVISFLPEDIMMIKGSPKERRYYIDLVYGQIDRQYLKELSNYKTLLKQRNEVLKNISDSKSNDYTLLDVITEQLSDSADLVVNFRKNFIEKINSKLTDLHRFLSDKEKPFEFRYSPSIERNFEVEMKKKYKKDIYLKTTSSGPHRDDYEFILDNLTAKDNASQGEQRIMVLALILAISETIFDNRNERPIFLLDDVFSELDTIRQNKLIEYLIKLNAQTIITTTNIDTVDNSILDKSKILSVSDDAIREETINGWI